MIYFAYLLGCVASFYAGWHIRPFVMDWLEVLRK